MDDERLGRSNKLFNTEIHVVYSQQLLLLNWKKLHFGNYWVAHFPDKLPFWLE